MLSSYLNGINNVGQVTAWKSVNEHFVSYVYSGNSWAKVDDPVGATGSLIVNINDNGTSVGWDEYPPELDTSNVVRWDGTAVTKLDTLGFGYITQAMDINNQGVIAGSGWAGSSIHAIRWNGTAATDIGTLGGSSSNAWGINESGQIAGSAATAGDDAVHAARWDANVIVDLGTLGGSSSR